MGIITYNLCSAHLARITHCKFLQPLRYLCQFIYLTTVKRVLRNSFDLNYLRKMCGTWAIMVSLGLLLRVTVVSRSFLAPLCVPAK